MTESKPEFIAIATSMGAINRYLDMNTVKCCERVWTDKLENRFYLRLTTNLNGDDQYYKVIDIDAIENVLSWIKEHSYQPLTK